jgi:hypothetical protein
MKKRSHNPGTILPVRGNNWYQKGIKRISIILESNRKCAKGLMKKEKKKH